MTDDCAMSNTLSDVGDVVASAEFCRWQRYDPNEAGLLAPYCDWADGVAQNGCRLMPSDREVSVWAWASAVRRYAQGDTSRALIFRDRGETARRQYALAIVDRDESVEYVGGFPTRSDAAMHAAEFGLAFRWEEWACSGDDEADATETGE